MNRQQITYYLFFIFLAIIVLVSIFCLRLFVNEVTVTFSDGTTVRAEVADTDWSRQKGLAGHAPLESEEGMLFVFDQKAFQTFWMKGVTFPIDIIWIDEEVVVGFEQHVQPWHGQVVKETLYRSPVPVQYVLEVPAGFVQQNGVQIGDSLTF